MCASTSREVRITVRRSRRLVSFSQERAGTRCALPILEPMSESSLEGHVHRNCGGLYEYAVERVTVRASGMSADVERGLFRCPRCGDEQSTLEQRESAEQAAVAAIRAEYGLMEPREMRALRNRLGLTTAQLSELMYGTPKGIVEGWLRGRYLQNVEADRLLRSLADPEVLSRRAARAGITLPEPGKDLSEDPTEFDSSTATTEPGAEAHPSGVDDRR